jgi:hypothetical protein
MQLHDTHGKRLYLTAEERRAFLAAAAKAARPVRTLYGELRSAPRLQRMLEELRALRSGVGSD